MCEYVCALMKDFSSNWADTEAADGLFRAAFQFALVVDLRGGLCAISGAFRGWG